MPSSRWCPALWDQVPVHEPSPYHAGHDVVHLLACVERPYVVFANGLVRNCWNRTYCFSEILVGLASQSYFVPLKSCGALFIKIRCAYRRIFFTPIPT